MSRGLSGQDVTGATFDDSAPTAVSAGTAPYGATFRPQQALAALAGKAATGTYTLTVTNGSSSNIATLNGWSLAYRKSADATVTAPVDVIGTAADLQGAVSYVLTLAPEGTSDVTVLRTGAAVSGGVLGRIDPTLLANGFYTLELTVTNAGGRSTTVDQPIDIEGGLKLGDFRQSFTDLTVNVAGIPIVVSRTYDSLDSNTSGDFGYGWHLDVGDAKLKVSLPDDTPTGWGGYPSFLDGTRVYVTLPGGKAQGYTFKPYEESLDSLGILNYWHPYFKPDAGDTLNLSVQDVLLSRDPDTGEYSSITDSGIDEYNPADWNYGGHYDLTDFDGTIYRIGAEDGKLQSITDLNGNILTFTPDGVTNQYGVGVGFTRDFDNRITVVTDPLGNTIHYNYDGYGDLTSVTDQMDYTTTYTYNTASVLGQAGARPHYLQQVNDPLNRPTTRAQYGADGRLEYVYDVNGNAVQTSFAPGQNAEVVTDKLGHVTVYVSDDLGNVVQQTQYLDDGTPVTSKWSYDGNLMMSSTDPLGNVTAYGYDSEGNQTSVVLPHDPGDDPADFTTQYVYNQYGEVTETLTPGGGGEIITYDANGNETSEADLNGQVLSSTTYDSNGLVLSSTVSSGTTTYQYDSLGRVSQQDANGQVTTFQENTSNWITSSTANDQTFTTAYDKLGRKKHEDSGGGVTADYTYNANGTDWTSMNIPNVGQATRNFNADGTLQSVSSHAGTASYTYDANGNVLAATNADSQETDYIYDALGRETSEKNLATNAITTTAYDLTGNIASTTKNGVTTSYTYYPDGRTKTMTVAGRTWSYAYTPTATRTTGPDGQSTTTETDPYGLPLKTTSAGGLTTKITYVPTMPNADSQDLPASSNDAEGRTRTYTYDANGNPVSATDLAGNPYTITTDATGTRITGPTGETLSSSNDSQGRVQSWAYADGSTTTMTYDGDNTAPATITLPSQAVITNQYDSSGNLISRTTSTGESAGFDYTQGQMTSVTDATGTTQYTYDAFGEVASVTSPTGASVVYHRNANDQVDTVTSQAGPTATAYVTHYYYNSAGKIDHVVDPFDGTTTYTYDIDGQLATETLPNGMTTTYGRDIDGRVTLIIVAQSNGNVLDSFKYTLAGDGEPIKIVREDGSYVLLGYDTALRLNSETYYDAAGTVRQAITYTYDLAGNRTVKTDGNGPHYYTYQTDKLTSVEDYQDGTGESYGYDLNGDVSSISRSGQSLTLGYDTSGHLTSVQGGGSGPVSYTYDGNGSRVGLSDPTDGTTTSLVAPTGTDGMDSTYLVTDGSGALVDGFVYVGSTPLLRFGSDGKPVYYLDDLMNSVIGLADRNGNQVAKFNYDSFGNLLSATGTAASAPAGLGGDFRFHGSWLDQATGLYNMGARTYDPQTGRFLSRDPNVPDFKIPEESNLYNYANDNPQLYTDPTGRFEVIEINISISSGDTIDAAHAAAVQRVRQTVKDKIFEALEEYAPQLLTTVSPELGLVVNSLVLSRKRMGVYAQHLIQFNFAKATGLPSWLWLAPQVRNNGVPVTDGLNPTRSPQYFQDPGALLFLDKLSTPLNQARPDFILGPFAPTLKLKGVNWTVGDVKLAMQSITDSANGAYPQKLNQFYAITGYASKFVSPPIAVWIAVEKGKNFDTNKYDFERACIAAESRGFFIPIVIVVL